MKSSIYILLMVLAAGRAGAQSGNMEIWRNYTTSPLLFPLEAPTGWYGSDSALIAFGYGIKPAGDFKQQVFKTTASHTGSYAVKLMTRNMTWQSGLPQPYVAVLSNAKISVDSAATPQFFNFIRLNGGTPVSQRISSVSLWMMQDSVHPDKCMLQIRSLLAGQGVGGKDSVVGDTFNTFYFAPNPGYNLVTVPVPYINSTVVPDHIAVAIYSGSYFVATAPYDSATLYVDDVILNAASGVSYSILKEPKIRCVLHQAGGYIDVSADSGTPMVLQVYDAAGRTAGNYPFTGDCRVDLPMEQPAAASLFYRITDRDGRPVKQGRFVIAE